MVVFIVLVLAVAGMALWTVHLIRRQLPDGSPISQERDRRNKKVVFIIAGLITILGVIPLLGLPGMGWVELAEPLAKGVCPVGSLNGFGANASWPTAIYITILWPSSLITGYGLVRISRSRSELYSRLAAALIVVALWGLVLALLMYLGYCLTS